MMSNASSVAGLLAKKHGFISKNHKGTQAKNEPEGVQQKQSKSEVKQMTPFQASCLFFLNYRVVTGILPSRPH